MAWVERSPQGVFSFRCPTSPTPTPPIPISGCQFAIFEQLDGEPSQAYGLSPQPPTDGTLTQWQWYPAETGGTSTGQVDHLYPQTWYRYGGVFHSQIGCEQFSPIQPHNYQETSYPLGVFEWRFHNPSDRPVTLSIMLTWENLLGTVLETPEDTTAPTTPRLKLKFNGTGGNFNRWVEDFFRVGCTLMNRQALGEDGYLNTTGAPPVNQGQWAIVTVENPAVEVFYHTGWQPDGDGSDLWDTFAADGSLVNENGEQPTEAGKRVGAAIAVRFTVRPGRSRTIPFMVCWDLPTSPLGSLGGDRNQTSPNIIPYRATDFFGRDGQNAWYMGRTALKHYNTWREKIQHWQQDFLTAGESPESQRDRLNSLGQFVLNAAPWTAASEFHPRGQLWPGDRSDSYPSPHPLPWELHELWPALEHSQIRSNLDSTTPSAQQPANNQPKNHYLKIASVLRLHRACQETNGLDLRDLSTVLELIDLWPALEAALEPVSKMDWETPTNPPLLTLPNSFGDEDWMAWELALEAAIALGELLIAHWPTQGFPVHLPAPDVSPETLAAAIATYQTSRTQIRQQLAKD